MRKGHQDFVSVVSDIDRDCLIEVIDSHKQDDIIASLRGHPLALREAIEEVSVDMWGEFPKVIAEVFPHARVVFDRFHVMQSVNRELNKHFKSRTTSGVMEGINNRVKLIMRQGYGFSNFSNFRSRVLACFNN
jgi:transposase